MALTIINHVVRPDHRITIDFEARSAADLKRWGVQRYSLDPSTQVLCLSWGFDDFEHDDVGLWHRNHPWIAKSPRPDELIARIKEGWLVEAHNAGMEFYTWNNTLRREFPEFDIDLRLDQLRCSAAKASCLSLPRALGDACDALALPERKDKDGDRLIQKLSKPMACIDGRYVWCEEEIEHRRNWEYNKQDVRAEHGLSSFCPEMTPTELRYWQMDFRMNQRGIYLDADSATLALDMATDEMGRLNAELRDLTSNKVEKGSQRARVKLWINTTLEALGQPPLPDTKADTLSFALYGVPMKAADETKKARAAERAEYWEGLGYDGMILKRVLEVVIDVNKTSVSKYKQMIQSVCPDGRLHDIMLYNGADRPVSGDAEVLTPDGWLKIEDWTGGEIAQWSHIKGGEGEITFAPATRAAFDHEGDLIRLRGPSSELLCTPDHRIPTISCRGNLTTRRAGDLCHMNWAIPLGGHLKKNFVSHVQTRLVVMFQADGRAGRSNLHFTKRRKIERCQNLLQEAGIDFSLQIHPDGTTTIQTHNAPAWLEQSKKFGPWLLDHDPAIFVDELKHWDGCTDPRNLDPGTSYATCSRINAEWVQTMASLAGTRAHIQERPDRDPNWNTGYRVHVHSSGSRSWLKKGWTFEREPGSGKVYCARTQTGYFLVRYRGTIQVTGNTGRWSGKGVQPHNFVRGYKEEMPYIWEDIATLDPGYVTLVTGDSPMTSLAKACRGALVATPGLALYAADFNAIEARKLAWLSGCASMLNIFSDIKGDIYIDMAQAIYKRPLNKKENPNERNLGKKAILGLGYAMGWEKFQMTVWMDEGIWLEDEFCQAIVNIYRKDKYPEVPALWKGAQEAAIAAVREGGVHWCGGDENGVGAVAYFMSDDGNFLHCRLPSGRLLAYLYPRVSQKVNYRFAAFNQHGRPTTVTFPAKKSVNQARVRRHAEQLAEKQKKTLDYTKQPTSYLSLHLSFMGRDTYTKQWKRLGTHGGTLVENFDQASSRDLLAEAMERIDQMDDFDLLLSIHDEVIAEAPIGACTLEEYEAIMAEVPNWAPGMPINAEGWIGPRLRK